MLTTLEKQKEKLAEFQAKVAALAKEIEVTERRFTNEQAAVIDGLPKRLNAASLEAVIVMIRARIKGELGSIITGKEPAAPRTKRVLTPEQHAKLDELLREVIAPGYAGELSNQKIADLVPCSTSTVGNRRMELKKALAKLSDAPPPAPPAIHGA